MRVVLTLSGLESEQKVSEVAGAVKRLLNREALMEGNKAVIELESLELLEEIDVAIRKFGCSILKVETEK
ncbi:hypothetical protein AT15_08615 [Kosmotoga arenicorallina S304]|uniref:HMA domain-containing protein n=1 Tax=Kosmotoga arenicorallina S304 TaxID=1453497 RepID=A0A176K1L1_9BACT|nr:hypothetical protein [Kosmotoga arenicorallina]OAA31027.1 hypothetical protein AT15_08615 [Kosmotoga arenicorallina S304]